MRHISLLVATLACTFAAAQGQPSYTENAKSLLQDKMGADWNSKVSIVWGDVRAVQFGREVSVVGYGLVSRESASLQGVFTFEAEYHTIQHTAPRLSYRVLRWSNEGEPNDRYMVMAAQAVARQRIESDARTSLRLDFTDPKLSNQSPETRVVEGTGTYSGRGGLLTGSFQYSVRFSRKSGAIDGVQIVPLASNPGVGWGGQHNAFTEGVAQAHASEYVRAREGSSVQVQFTGPVNHVTVAKGLDRVSGRGQWRRSASFQWADFRYDVQVGIEDGRIQSAMVSLTPDIHGGAEDQKFITFAQSAVRRDFRAQSPAQPTFLSARVSALPFGKKSVSGEFSAGGKRYAYDVVVDAASTRTDRVTISRKG
ncbi:MAG: hypothetical protein M3R13_09580 [Armatimonadota bacterium]|nr:hypothetical protein [Armatimonadota bacterium]